MRPAWFRIRYWMTRSDEKRFALFVRQLNEQGAKAGKAGEMFRKALVSINCEFEAREIAAALLANYGKAPELRPVEADAARPLDVMPWTP